jgi:hypothetical protein
VTWVDPPATGMLVAFATFLAGSGVPHDEWQNFVGSDRILGGLINSEGRALVVTEHRQAMPDDYRSTCERLLLENRFTYGSAHDPTAGGSFLWLSNSVDVPTVSDLPAPLDPVVDLSHLRPRQGGAGRHLDLSRTGQTDDED